MDDPTKRPSKKAVLPVSKGSALVQAARQLAR
jgi:hypothetical protein